MGQSTSTGRVNKAGGENKPSPKKAVADSKPGFPRRIHSGSETEASMHMPALMAHRGAASSGVPQNSRQAFDQILESGLAAGLETDVHATADGRVVISHDPQLHFTSGDVLICRSTWAKLSKYRFTNGEPVLSLDEFMDRYPNTYLSIDAKNDAVVKPLIQLLRGRTDLKRFGLGSFSSRRVMRLAKGIGCAPGYLLGGTNVANIMLLAASGLVTSGTVNTADYFQSMREKSLGEKTVKSWFNTNQLIPRLVKEYRCALAVPETFKFGVPIVTSRFVATAHLLGLPVYVWTVNETVQYRRLSNLGVDGVYTDNVMTLAKARS